jgi:hypothetical protein
VSYITIESHKLLITISSEHHKHDKDLTQAERDAKKEHKHELKQEKKDHHYGRDAAVAGGVGGLAEQ